MNTTVVSGSDRIAIRLEVGGLVQGVGMRPFVATLANELNICGHVQNNEQGVVIHAEGNAAELQRFQSRVRTDSPQQARIDTVRRTDAALSDATEFHIQSSGAGESLSTLVPPDVGLCHLCAEEVLSQDNRRHQYPFTTCTNCGPRYSLIEQMPYDRDETTMESFRMCPECTHEYLSSGNRRFHSQTNACESCGPQIAFTESENLESTRGTLAIESAARAIREGLIVAVKGIGGYQLFCDATSSTAVKQLRQRKHRPLKPLAVMTRNVEEAEGLVYISAEERAELTSSKNAIVLLRKKDCSTGTGRESSSNTRPFVSLRIAPEVSPHSNHVGVMLPTSPLHLLILEQVDSPCVVTSANHTDEPLAYDESGAEQGLRGVADAWLHHDRAILRPIDDSVVHIVNRQSVTIRSARGYAPAPLAVEAQVPILAVGGQQKVAVALAHKDQAILGPHLGDMASISARERFNKHVVDLCDLYQVQPSVIAHDLHPDLFTTRWGKQTSSHTIAVQHHHAHVAAGMVEHQWLDKEVLGVAFDGTGYGDDGTIWGGEFLLCTATDYRRVARLRPFPLVGGERAISEPWRLAAVLLAEAGFNLLDKQHLVVTPPAWKRQETDRHLQQFPRLIQQRGAATSSMGRLFDGVAAMLLRIGDVSYEGEAAARLEAVCDTNCKGHYALPIVSAKLDELDWRPMVRQIVADIESGVAVGMIAIRFIRGVAVATASVCRRYSAYPVVLSGGCFQNAVLSSELKNALESHPAEVGFPGRIPPNDGGLAAGQLAVAAALIGRRNQTEGAI